ncbi:MULTISPECIES: hypothetical protein [unclassified Gordonia (in: high G+C Gram-positive bacteria)]|uniref:hypothetical protein n=1 Tax=unclassified Gordonia (in: high G+C Gram-positive bacteria) TaxID=2657482 RepID=UPI0009AF1F1C|nr:MULTISPECIES: hypothetical protein [unclassified Gordonia (in: high G+C Gram-positive bacteria)]MDF3285543.1 hypothetical protein [Gordonia sp. N1V]OPX15254.1 hypothetical protein B1964_11175 [Gordonia sp. i37]
MDSAERLRYTLVLETALSECGYLDDLPPGDTVSLDGIVAVSRITHRVGGRVRAGGTRRWRAGQV